VACVYCTTVAFGVPASTLARYGSALGWPRMGPSAMSMTATRRLPAYGRAIRASLNAGLRPVVGNTVAVCVDWPERCALAHVVCLPRDRGPDEYEFGFIAGVDTIVWFREQDRGYAEAVRTELAKAGSPVIAMLCVPEEALS
jgi:hypothetical protein